jgi:protein-tyrosine-phosphatase
LKILFVCVKNASRSPMAEALLKMSALRRVKVCSAGIKPGKHVNEQAVKAMREIGYDLTGDEPKHISAFSHIKFDYVGKMDVADLGDIVTAKWIEDWDIPDPAQGGSAEYRKVRQMIADKICNELPHLLAQPPKRSAPSLNLSQMVSDRQNLTRIL